MKIWRKIIHSHLGKGIALLLTGSLLTDIFMPTVSLALTGGPSQPEFQGFSEVGVSNMVDPFTGDFSYEIPLMTVPGPNGGYPINLTYGAGAGMEDEASWVGLGWNLNPGAINRSMRGVPDDFSGPQKDKSNNVLVSDGDADHITKSMFTKENVTVGVGLGITLPPTPEVATADLGNSSSFSVNPNVNLYYNTYKGVGFRAGIGMKLSSVAEEGSSGGASAGLNLSFDSNDGASLQPSLSMSNTNNNKTTAVTIGFGYNSRQGITNTFLSSSVSKSIYTKTDTKKGTSKSYKRYDNQSTGNSVSFAATSGVPSTTMPMSGFNGGFNLDFEAGAMQSELNIPVNFSGMLSVQKVKDWMIDGYDYPAYGTMYSGYRDNADINADRALMDYNREKEAAINLKLPMMPLPVMTHDVYAVTGAGIGGAFRTFRNDVGTFYEPRVSSDFLGITLGLEIAASTGFKIGIDPTVNFTHSYSGKWRSDAEQLEQTNFFRKKDQLVTNNVGTIQPFDFRFTNELTAHTPGDNRFATLGGNGAVNYTLFPATADFPDLSETEYEDPDAQTQMNKFFPFKNLSKFKPKASNKLNGTPVLESQTVRTQKERRMQLVEYRTKAEVQFGGQPYPPSVIVNDPSQVMPSKTAFDLTQNEIKKHHVAEFSIVQPGGMRYVYGLPLYNRTHEEYYFAIPPGTPANSKTVTIGGLNSLVTSAKKGQHGDKYFSSTKISPYAHTYLLTHIVSPDYMDVDNNGPSENDYGYWTKLNYRPIDTYGWRVPVQQDEANYIEGYASSPNDDKATFTYGERDMTFLHSIETKTHVAVFYVSNREDARGSTGLNGGVTGAYSKKLDKIVLYAKGDLTKPLKSVHFDYTYELCNHAANNSQGGGKLTLKSIYFKYGDSPKGALSPYKFEYGVVYKDQAGTIEMANSGLNGNPGYVTQDVDRWGSYKQPQGVSNLDNPYVEQAAAGADRRLESATAWNLTDITLPTGAMIKISYETDDYGFVQDKPATEMYRIAGMGKTDGSGDKWLVNEPAPITDDYRRVYFYLDGPGTQVADIKRMLDELPDGKIYFKTWQRLQVPKGESSWVEDYVNGYAPVLKTAGSYGIVSGPNSQDYGYFTLADDYGGPANARNFFRKAGLQYLRHQRADLDMPQNQGSAALQAASMIITGIPIIVQALQMIQGYYNWAINKGHCKYIGNVKPSYIKLGIADGIKYGGGHRVRKITISDIWEDLSNGTSATYGMEYHYRTTDESGRKVSTGVASYEPLIGGDENPFKKAHYYGPDNKFALNDPAFFLEEPFGESYFPAPVVGYSKTVVVNLANRLNIKTGDGITSKEFYTARDFPIKTSFTQQPQRIEDKQTVFIPIIATIQFKGYGYSQGYYVELNDMHGKPKAETLYDADYWDVAVNDWTEDDPPFVSKKMYKYKASGKNLINTVDVLDADQQVRTAIMGETSEMFSEMKEDFGYSMSAGAQLNAGVDPVPLGIFVSGFPNFEYSENSARTLVTTKIVYKNGILDEVVDMAEGAVKKTKNLLYDPETGAPLLTAVTGDFDNPQKDVDDQYIYNYTYPAHWYYPGMQAAYRNYRNVYIFNGTTSFPNADQYLQRGDELLSSSGVRVWVKEATATGLTLTDAVGTHVVPNGTYVTLRSGKRNQQSSPAGALSSLENPVGGYKNVFLEFYNNNIYNNPAYSAVQGTGQSYNVAFSIPDCADPSLVYTGKLYLGNHTYPNDPAVEFAVNPIGHSECNTLVFKIPAQIAALGFVPSRAKFSYYDRENVLITYTHPLGAVYKIPVPVTPPCFPLNFCLDGVLNATANEFSDDWTYNAGFTPPAGPLALNDYLKGRRGVWRMLRANAYFSERKQRKAAVPQPGVYDTYIGRDGTYERFVVFDWLNGTDPDGDPKGNTNNLQAPLGWRWQAEVTPGGYSPYGYEIENRNALNIFSAELYGYGNSLVIASAQEATYPEIGFDGFEEIPTSSAYAARGQLQVLTAGTASLLLNKTRSHTGDQCLLVNGGTGGRIYLDIPVSNSQATFLRNGKLEMLRNNKYIVGFWYRFAAAYSGPLKLDALDGTTTFQSININTASAAIEGWRRAEVAVETGLASPTATGIRLRMDIPANTIMYIDDLRIHPANAAFKTFVYDRYNFLLRAILDDNNYASFYDYDEENTLTQVKKETEEGVRTIQTTRKNVKR